MLTKEGAKKRSADFMKDFAATQAAEQAQVGAQIDAEVDTLCDDAASFAYRDTQGGKGRRGRSKFSLAASYLPIIINGQRIME